MPDHHFATENDQPLTCWSCDGPPMLCPGGLIQCRFCLHEPIPLSSWNMRAEFRSEEWKKMVRENQRLEKMVSKLEEDLEASGHEAGKATEMARKAEKRAEEARAQRDEFRAMLDKLADMGHVYRVLD